MLLPVAGVPILARSVRTVLDVAGVHRIVLVVRREDRDAVSEAVAPHLGAHDLWVVDGGEQRHDSEWQALRVARRRHRERRDRRRRHPRRGPTPRRPTAVGRGDRRRRRARGRDPGRRRPRSSPTPTAPSRPADWSACRPRRPSAPATCSRPTASADADGFVGTDTAACLERYARRLHRRRREHDGQPQGDLPRGHRAGRDARRTAQPVARLSATSTSRSASSDDPAPQRRAPPGGAPGSAARARRRDRPGRRCPGSRGLATTVAGSTTGEVTQTSPSRSTVAPSRAGRRTP